MSTPKSPQVRVLIVDDEECQRTLLANMTAALGFAVSTASDGEDALAQHAALPADVILTDLMMPRMDGFDLLRTLESRGDRTPTIVLTGVGGIEQGISVVHDLKAFWFLEKPVQAGILRALLERAVAQKRLIDETDLLNRQLSHRGVLGEIVGGSAVMRQLYSLISQVAPTSASVFITGESGTGKELVARAVHRLSPRAGNAFIAINCAAMPETLIESELFGHEKGAFTGAVERHAGCFEQAHDGTVLLDEIADMPIGTQTKLLRLLEEGKVRRLGGKGELPVNVRVIAATNWPPDRALKENRLREDLFYRLNVFHIALPPLRERKEDIPAICDAILSNLNKKHGCHVSGLHPEVLESFQNASWPGNVRQLRNVLERAVIVAVQGTILRKHLPADKTFPNGSTAAVTPRLPDEESIRIQVGPPMSEVEQSYIDLVLKHTNNNKTRAAEILGLSLRTLQNRVREMSERDAKRQATN
ncbi:MAG: two component, sigma54 specific, transcriptional regulator, Fis family [Bryobacterales bacterium]|nr:two component, sigma54 specific, transcriptional regulator, Fis family [Bryobacterales bacterium]